MKKIMVVAALVGMLWQGTAMAQEREPLAMRILADWTGAGILMGVAAGATLWLTDPGKPENQLGEQVAGGAAWGAVAGAVLAVFMLSEAVIEPRVSVSSPGLFHPSQLVAADPVVAADRAEDLFGGLSVSRTKEKWLFLPVLHFRF